MQHDTAGDAPITLGAVTLTAAQANIVHRARAALHRRGGVLLADDTGAGKTFIALALAAPYGAPVLVVAPAALRTTWLRAMHRTAVHGTFCSYEQLSRGASPAERAGAVIFDEAHHLRTPATRRYRAARTMCAGLPVILASATPVHNRVADRDALLALFMGVDAADIDDATRGTLIVRGTALVPHGPSVTEHPAHPIADVRAIAAAIGALPGPAPPRDGGTALALWRMSLLRAWCSSAAALASMLRRAELSAAALLDAWQAGRTPSRRELGPRDSGNEEQLAWAELTAPAGTVTPALVAHAQAHRAGVRRLRALVAAHEDTDRQRALVLRQIMQQHDGAPVLACTQYAATVDALWRALRGVPGVAALTARGGRIASGRLPREDVLARFAPVARGVRPPPPRERIALLITTDVVSEGLDLQDAGVIVHLDTPWTPARMAQRMGRLTRPGSPHATVHVHRVAPPYATAALLRLEQRLRAKRAAARATRSPAEAQHEIETFLAAWHRAPAPGASGSAADVMAAPPLPRVAAADTDEAGWIALVTFPGPRLIAALGRGAPSTSPVVVARALAALDRGQECDTPSDVAPRVRAVLRWVRHDCARCVAMTTRPVAARRHHRTLGAAVQNLARAPAHQRAALAVHGSTTFAQLAVPPEHPAYSIAPLVPSIIILLQRNA